MIQKNVLDYLLVREWFARPVGPSAGSCGWPDIYAAHNRWGPRWIEIKVKDKYSFTAEQLKTFPLLHAQGVGIWILTSHDDEEMNKLFKPANWWTYLNVR